MDAGVQIVFVQLSPSSWSDMQGMGRLRSSLSGVSRDTIRAALESAMDVMSPTNMADVQYRAHLGTLEREGLSGRRQLVDVAVADRVQSIQPSPSGGDVLMLELGLGGSGSGSIMNAIA